MDFGKYQKLSRKTAFYPKIGKAFVYPSLGLAGDAGEVAEKIKKELGDVLWYLTQIATEFNLPLEEIAKDNLKKLISRKKRGKLKGEGDNR